jgi:hypothetical protein
MDVNQQQIIEAKESVTFEALFAAEITQRKYKNLTA